MPEAVLVATLAAPPAADGSDLAALPPAVRCLEVRADLVGDLDPDWLRSHFPGELLYTLRSAAEEGGFAGAPAERRARLLAAAARYDLVDLESERDLEPELLGRLPAARRLISRHGAVATAGELRARCDRMAATAARLYRLAVPARAAADGLAPLELLRSLRRADLTAFATGPAGSWSRLLAPRLGAPIAFGRVGGTGGARAIDADGAFDIARLIDDYGLPNLYPVRRLYGIVGRSIGRSLSPRLHNAAYRRLRLPALYLPFQTESLAAFLAGLEDGVAALGMPLGGFTVTSPHKESALAWAASATPLARRAGAANTLLRRNGSWQADTADAQGVMAAAAARQVPLAGRRVAVVGCGGAGRAAAAGLLQAGARVTLVNRGPERGEHAARLLGLPFVPLADFSPRGYALVLNATPCTGAGPDDGAPFDCAELDAGAVLIDLPYGSARTPLVTAAAAGGRTVIDGREVLLIEAQHQFELRTGHGMAAAPARALLDGASVSVHATVRAPNSIGSPGWLASTA